MKKCCLLLFFVFNMLATHSEPLYNYTNHNFYKPHIIKRDLTALEKYALNRTYRHEADLDRLERLENLAFGAIQNGEPSYRYRNLENAILSRPKIKQQTGFKNFSNYFSGQTTGFTPNLLSHPRTNNLGGFNSNPYLFTPNPSYNNNRIESYSNGIFGGGWRYSGQNYGTGSSIRILD